IARQNLCGKTGLLLIEVDGDDLEGKRRTILEREQNVQERVAVFAPREAYHHPVALFDQAEVADRLTDEAAQALLQLVGLETCAPRISCACGPVRRGRRCEWDGERSRHRTFRVVASRCRASRRG